MVKFGSARISEFNSVNGFRGDQTGTEVMEQQAYWHRNGWIGLRAKDANVANSIAWLMKCACISDVVGYSQNDRYAIFFSGLQEGVPTNADCSSLVAFCVWQSGIQNFEVNGFYTGNEVERLMGTGAFDKFAVNSLEELHTGDILVDGNLTSHTVVVTEGLPRNAGNVFDEPLPTLQWGDTGNEVRKLQGFFNEYGNAGLKVDGAFGKNTRNAVRFFQGAFGLEPDGIYGPKDTRFTLLLFICERSYNNIMESIIVALITGGLAFLGTLISSMIANSKTLYRIEQLEKAQNKHNSLIERMYKVEKAIEVDEERLKYIEEDVEELKDVKA